MAAGLDAEQRARLDTNLAADPNWDRRAEAAAGLLTGGGS